MQDKVALITGSGRRIGAAIAESLHASGMCILLHYHHSEAAVEALANKLNALRPNSAHALSADLLDLTAINALITSGLATFGQIDALINNASSFYPTPVGAITETNWNDLIGSNLRAPLFLAQAAAPHLAQTRGVIINITDIHAERPLKDYVVYSIAKAGLAALTQSLARELGPEIRVNAVAPGAIIWPEDGQFTQAERDAVLSTIPLEKIGEADDIARTVRFLVQDAPYITGQTLRVDGGRSVVL